MQSPSTSPHSEYELDLDALGSDDSEMSLPQPDRILSEDVEGPTEFTLQMDEWMRGDLKKQTQSPPSEVTKDAWTHDLDDSIVAVKNEEALERLKAGMNKEREQWTADMDEERARWKTESEQLRISNEQFRTSNEQLRTSNERLRHSNNALSKDALERESDRGAAEKLKVDEDKERVQQLEQRFNALELEMDEKAAELDAASERINHLNDTLNRTNNELAAERLKTTKQDEEMARLKASAIQAEQRNEELTREMEIRMSRLDAALEQNKHLTERLDRANDELAAGRLKSVKKGEMARLKASAKQVEQRNEELTREMEIRMSQLDAALEQNKRLDERLDRANDESAAGRLKTTKKDEEISELKGEREQFEDLNNSLKRKFAREAAGRMKAEKELEKAKIGQDEWAKERKVMVQTLFHLWGKEEMGKSDPQLYRYLKR